MADRELVIKFRVDTTEADAASDAFWQRERQRQAQAQSAGPGGAAGGGGQRGPAGGPAPQPVSATGVLPGNAPGLMPLGAANAAAGGTLPGMIMPIPAAAAMGQIGQAGGPGARAALPGPTGGGISIPPAGAQPIANAGGGWEVLPAGGGAGATRITPTPVATPGGGGGGGGVTAAQGLALGAAGLGVAKNLQDAALQSERQATTYSQQLGAEVAQARDANREIAALRGMPNTGATAAQMAQEAAGAGITPDQWRDFQTGYQAYAGQYVGNKISAEQSQRLQQQVASFAVGSRGWKGADASRLLGTVISKAKPGASDDEILGQYSQLAQVMQLAPGYTGPLLGQLSEVVGETVGENGEFGDALDAAILTRGVSERNPRTASAYSRAVLRGLRRARANPEMSKELGITKGMDAWQQLEAVQHAADAAKARGEDEGTFLEKHGFGEIRQYGGIRTALDSGLRGGGFARARQEALADQEGGREEMARRLRAESGAHAGTEMGSAAGDEAAIAAARLREGAKGDEWRRLQRRAAVAVESSGDMKRGEGPIGGFLTWAGSWFTGDRREQETHAEAARQLEQGLGSSAAGRRYLQTYRDDIGETPQNYLTTHRRGGEDRVFEEMANELKRIRESMDKQTRILERDPAYRARHGMGPAAAVTVQQPGNGDGR